MRIGYAGQNGREYVAIGRLLRERGILPPGGASMQSIKDWIRANPDQGRALMRENLSYIFFKELTGPGPLGALERAASLRRRRSPPIQNSSRSARRFSSTCDRPKSSGLWVAQDIGGAIKGPNRFDTFWGAGDEAVAIAGGMSAIGRGADPAAQGHCRACARSTLTRRRCGRGSRPPSVRFRAKVNHRKRTD